MSVIGPNGCGKSNIVDSIRWCLGEQSAKSLRGGEMIDVIFNGSHKRRPGAFAEVEVVFNNDDKSLNIDNTEVSIRRKLHRTGDAEYYLNGEPCRLKDIRELFMDTGIGAKTNTVIEQEQLTRLLQANSKERKILIEEAAGISRFRQRRQESALKLGRVNDNMTRLKDIVEEVTKQKRSVSAQASKAMRYEKLQKDLRRNRLDLAVVELHGWMNDRLVNEEERERLENQIKEFRKRDEELQKSMESLNEEEQRLEAELMQFQTEQESFVRTFTEAENRVKNLGESVERTEAELKENEERLLELEQEFQRAKSQGENGEDTEEASDTSALDREIEELRTNRDALQQKVQSLRDRLTQGRDREVNFIRRRSEINNEIIRAESAVEYSKRRLDEAEERELDIQEKLENATGVEGGEQALEAAKEKAKTAKQNFEKRSDDLEELRRELQASGQYAYKLQSEFSSIQSRLNLLKEMENHYEGMGGGVRAVMESYAYDPEGISERPKGVHGPVADLIEVPDKYVNAIEAALGPRMQNIVTTRAEDAKHAIAFLRERKAGRVTFLPLDRIQERKPIPRQLLSMPGVQGEAVNLVGYAHEYKTLAGHLLTGTLVVDTMDHALAIHKEMRCRIVTLAGELISPEGAMTGGGKEESRVLSRKAEIADLEEKLNRLQEDQGVCEGEVERMREKETNMRDHIQQLGVISREAEDGVRDIEHKFEMAEKDVRRLRNELVILSREKDNLNKKLEEENETLKKVREELDKLQAPSESEEVPDEEKEALPGMEEELNHLGAKLQDREMKRVAILERSQSRAASAAMLKDRITSLESDIARTKKRIEEKTETKTELTRQLGEASEQFDKMNRESEGQQGRFGELKQKRLDVRNRRSEIQGESHRTSEGLRREEKALSDLAVRDEGLRVNQKNLFQRIHDEFHLNIEDHYLSRRQSQDPLFEQEERFVELAEEMRREIAELEAKISNLGNVNFEAVEELKGLEERESYLSGQMKDLDDSHKKLDGFIRDLDRQCNEMFSQTFDAVKGHFQSMFSRLFGGGKGSLELESGVDPLEAGVSISASPPGKSPKVLTQLSGGEKVLTTIAFLFSIFLYKPSPFCILDEIDAPLDEHNVDRFMNAIRSFTDRCQFLMVTHNRRTMSLCDLIHGVTMQESGVSRTITIEMDQLEHIDIDNIEQMNELEDRSNETETTEE